jgi:hypothetical protein
MTIELLRVIALAVTLIFVTGFITGTLMLRALWDILAELRKLNAKDKR